MIEEMVNIRDFELMVSETEMSKAGKGQMNIEIHWALAYELITRLREAEKDAARYRWLRDRVCMFYVSAEGCDSRDAYLTVTGYGDDDSREVVDAAIDDQMKENGDE